MSGSLNITGRYDRHFWANKWSCMMILMGHVPVLGTFESFFDSSTARRRHYASLPSYPEVSFLAVRPLCDAER